MRMEELNDSRYEKSTDTVERYLLNLVQEYFKHSNVAASNSKEYIIKKAVQRMQEELTFENMGVLSITLPDGTERTGAVTVTLQDLNGEPLISPKLTAFNVDFGDEAGTACEGNDPRLSDKRAPVKHTHNLTDITGLSGALSSIRGEIKKLNDSDHTHANKNVLDMLVYTGSKTSIDLNELETLDTKMINIIEEIKASVIDYKEELSSEITSTETVITEVRTEVSSLKDGIKTTNDDYLKQAKEYTDTQISTAKADIQLEIDKMVTSDTLTEIYTALNNIETYIGQVEINLAERLVPPEGYWKISEVGEPISAEIREILESKGQTLQDCRIEYNFIYTTDTGEERITNSPYLFLNDDYTLKGNMIACCVDNTIRVLSPLMYADIPEPERSTIKLRAQIYSKGYNE